MRDGPPLFNASSEQVREQERGKVIDRERHLIAVFRQGSLDENGAGVVDEHIDTRRALHHRRSEPPHIGERAEIRLQEFDRRIAAARFELCDRPRPFVRIAPVHEQSRALNRETMGGRLADSVRSAGDDADFVFQGVH